MNPSSVIIAPILSEKSNALREDAVKRYTFRVHLDANKHEIIEAVNQMFGVRPIACNTVNYVGKPKSSRGKSGFARGRRSAWKKAIVTMKKGDKITALEVL